MALSKNNACNCPCDEPQKTFQECDVGGADLQVSVFLHDDINILRYSEERLPFQVKLGSNASEIILNQGASLKSKKPNNNISTSQNNNVIVASSNKPWDSKRSAYRILEPGIYEFNAQVSVKANYDQPLDGSLIMMFGLSLEEVDAKTGKVLKVLKQSYKGGSLLMSSVQSYTTVDVMGTISTGTGFNHVAVGNYVQISLIETYVTSSRGRNTFAIAGLELGCNNTACKADPKCCPDETCPTLNSDAPPAPNTLFSARRIRSFDVAPEPSKK